MEEVKPTMSEIVPECLVYKNKPEKAFESKTRRKESVYLYPTQSGNIASNASNKTIKFLVGNEGFLDPINTYLQMDAQFSIEGGNANDRIQVVKTTEAFIKRFTILTANGSKVVEDIRNYNVLAGIRLKTLSEDYKNSVGNMCLNNFEGDVDTLDAIAKSDRRYVIEFSLSGLLSGDMDNRRPYIPLKLVAGRNSNSFIIEIEFANATEICQLTNGVDPAPVGTPQYLFKNFSIVQDILFEPDTEEDLFKEMMSGKAISYHVDTYNNYSNLMRSGTTKVNYVLSEFQESIRAVVGAFRLEENASNKDANEIQFYNPEIKSVQLKIGTHYFPSQPIECDANKYAGLYYEFLKAWNKNRRYNTGVKAVSYDVAGTDTYESSDFVLGINLRSFDDDCGSVPNADFFEGINNATNPQPIDLQLLGNAGADNYLVDTFVYYDRLLVLTDMGVEIV